MSLLDKIKGKREEIKLNRASQTRAYKFKVGKTVISLLPLHQDLDKPIPEQNFFREYGMHFIKNKKGENIVCVGDRSICFPGDECPVRDGLFDLVRYGNSIGDDDIVKYAKESIAKKNYLMNAIIHQDPDKKAEEAPQLVSLSETTFDNLSSILEEYLAEGGDDVLRFNQRMLFIVERTGSGKNDTRYSIMPAAARKDVPPAVMGKAVNLEEYVLGQYGDSVTKALSYLSTALGKPLTGTAFAAALTAAPGSKPAALSAPSVTEIDDLLAPAPGAKTGTAPALDKTRAIDAEFTEVAATAPATATAAEEDLLAEIDSLAAA